MSFMSRGISPENLGAAIEQELTLYAQDVEDGINKASEEAVKKLVKLTRATAPTGKRSSFRRHIASKLLEKRHGLVKYAWYVKPPDHRLTHLLVHGHAKKDGGRTRSNPFLQNALNVVEPEYERKVEEVLRK